MRPSSHSLVLRRFLRVARVKPRLTPPLWMPLLTALLLLSMGQAPQRIGAAGVTTGTGTAGTAPPATFAAATSKQQAAQLVNSDKVMRALATAGGLDQSDQAAFDSSFTSWAAFYNYRFQGAALDKARSNYQQNLQAIAKLNSNLAVPHWLGANQFAHLSSNLFGQRASLNSGPRPGTTGRRLHDLIPGEGAASTASSGYVYGGHAEERSKNPWAVWAATRRLQNPGGGVPLRKATALGSIANAAVPASLPEVKDWVAEGKVTRVRNQYGGQQGDNGCGSCWAFTAVAAIESAYLISKGINASSQPDLHLSEEQILDCCNPTYSPNVSTVSDGCNAGNIAEALSYAVANPLTTSFRIGYSSVNHLMASGTTGTCDPAAITRIAAETGQAVKLSSPGYKDITSRSKTALIQALAQGPVAIYFNSLPLQFYRGGVYADEQCGTFTNHAMLLVGYNTKGDLLDTGAFSAPYWLIKNQFGTGWGENGYIKVAMQDDGTVGICGMYLGPTQVIPSFVRGLDTLYATPPYPSPPPAPPPAPPAVQQWPQCDPGNTNGTQSFGWTVSLQSVTATQLTLQVQRNQACRPAGSACCQSSLQHIQLRVQALCYNNANLVAPLISSPDFPDGSVSPGWPEDTPNILDVELPGSGLTIASAKTSITIALTVDTTFKACPSRRSFFTRYNPGSDAIDQYTYAALGNGGQCCGTDVMAAVSNGPVDCQVSWSAWGPCNPACGGGTQSRTGSITQQRANGGAACPTLTQSQACNQQACSSPPTPPPKRQPPGLVVPATPISVNYATLDPQTRTTQDGRGMRDLSYGCILSGFPSTLYITGWNQTDVGTAPAGRFYTLKVNGAQYGENLQRGATACGSCNYNSYAISTFTLTATSAVSLTIVACNPEVPASGLPMSCSEDSASRVFPMCPGPRPEFASPAISLPPPLSGTNCYSVPSNGANSVIQLNFSPTPAWGSSLSQYGSDTGYGIYYFPLGGGYLPIGATQTTWSSNDILSTSAGSFSASPYSFQVTLTNSFAITRATFRLAITACASGGCALSALQQVIPCPA